MIASLRGRRGNEPPMQYSVFQEHRFFATDAAASRVAWCAVVVQQEYHPIMCMCVHTASAISDKCHDYSLQHDQKSSST